MRLINIYNLKCSLDYLCNFINKLYNINNGGCCYLAYLIACHLDRLKIKYDLIIYDYRKKDENCINDDVINMYLPSSVTGKQTCDHYCISILNGGIINNTDFTYLEKYVVKKITSNNIKWLYKNGKWSKVYNCNNNRYVKDIIDSFFLDYEKLLKK